MSNDYNLQKSITDVNILLMTPKQVRSLQLTEKFIERQTVPVCS